MAPLIDIMDCVYTVFHLPDELLGLSYSFLGDGGFGFIAPVCKRFKSTYPNRVSDKKTITVERATFNFACKNLSRICGRKTEQVYEVFKLPSSPGSFE